MLPLLFILLNVILELVENLDQGGVWRLIDLFIYELE